MPGTPKKKTGKLLQKNVGLLYSAPLSNVFFWEIKISQILVCKKVKDFVQSPKFTNNHNIEVCLRLYPVGLAPMFDDHFTLILFAIKSSETLAESHFQVISDTEKIAIRYPNAECVYKNGVGHVLLVSRDFASPEDEKITIVYQLSSPQGQAENQLGKLTGEEAETNADVQYRFNVMAKLNESLLDDTAFSDVDLHSEGKTVKAHKCILAKSSQVFAAMFNNDMKENRENRVEIVDIGHDVLVEMIRFIYTGKILNVVALITELAVAADKYALDELRSTCETTMENNLSLENLARYLQIAEKLDMDRLKERGIEFVVENGSAFAEKKGFESLSHDMLSKVCYRLVEKRNDEYDSF